MTDDDNRIAALKAEIAALEAKKTNAARSPELADSGAVFLKQKTDTKKHDVTGKVIAGVIVLGLVAWVASTVKPNPTNTSQPTGSAVALAASPEAIEPAAKPAPITPWSYTEDTDALTDGKTQTACTTSTNMVRLDWPYQSVTAKLCIRKSPRFGLDTFVTLNGDGQILCRSYEDCTLKVRFGDAVARSWPGVGAADGSSNIVFLRRSETLISQAKGVDQVIVELPMYQAGNQPIIFKTNLLEWPRP